MKSGSDSGVVSGALGLILILLLSFGGVATYYVLARQSATIARQAERARAAEALARTQAEIARAAAERAASFDKGISTQEGDPIRSAVESVLRGQEEAWNGGNLEAFMESYWKSDELSFSSGGKTTRGWTETLDRYRERYPTPEEMGRLTLSELEITPLGNSAALVLGQWRLAREREPASGSFSLVLRKFGDRWLIIHDHTSRLID
jgi:ketosteroid isomerase-like protein